MFWKFNLISTSHVETVLSRENATLQELMDEDDILQECKAQTKKLIDFLVRPEIMDEMVTLITQEPSEDQDEKFRYKYPNIACELLTSDVAQINDALVADDALLNKLYSFLESEKPLNPLLASFFTKVMGLLVSCKTEAIFSFLKSKEDFVSLLLNHIETSAIMDLLIRLVTTIETRELREPVVKWLSDQKVVEQVVALIDPAHGENCHSNASQALCEIIKASREHMSLLQESASPDPLLDAIERTDTIRDLLNHMFTGEKKESVLVNGIYVLLALLEFKKHGPAGQHQPLQPIPAESSDQQQQQAQQQSSSSTSLQGENAPQCFGSFLFRSDMPEQMTALDAERLAKGVSQVLEAVIPRLADFHDLLKNPPPKRPIPSTMGLIEEPLGATRLEVAHLVTAVLNSNTHAANLKLLELETLDLLLELFFKYTWNNFLHSQVEQSLNIIVSNQPTTDKEGNRVHPLANQLFDKCRIVEKILDAWDENEKEQCLPGKHRRGYMGHLTKMANHIAQKAENGPNSELIQAKLKGLPEPYAKRWEAFVSETLADINKKNQAPLGGGVPLPSCTDDEEAVGFRDIQETALQQAFSDYQMQQMTSSFVDQFGFNDDEFVDADENIMGQLDRLARVNFNLTTQPNMRSSELFEQACQERIQSLDGGDSDEDVWEDKEQEIAFASGAVAKHRRSLDNANEERNSSSDSDEEESGGGAGKAHLASTSTSAPLNRGEMISKMEIDQNDPWAAFDNGASSTDAAAVPVAMDTSNPWEAPSASSVGASGDSGGSWADFSSFATFAPADFCASPFPSDAMETSEPAATLGKAVTGSAAPASSSTSTAPSSTQHVPSMPSQQQPFGEPNLTAATTSLEATPAAATATTASSVVAPTTGQQDENAKSSGDPGQINHPHPADVLTKASVGPEHVVPAPPPPAAVAAALLCDDAATVTPPAAMASRCSSSQREKDADETANIKRLGEEGTSPSASSPASSSSVKDCSAITTTKNVVQNGPV